MPLAASRRPSPRVLAAAPACNTFFQLFGGNDKTKTTCAAKQVLGAVCHTKTTAYNLGQMRLKGQADKGQVFKGPLAICTEKDKWRCCVGASAAAARGRHSARESHSIMHGTRVNG